MLHTLLLTASLLTSDSAAVEPNYIVRHEVRRDSILTNSPAMLSPFEIEEWQKEDLEYQRQPNRGYEFVWQDEEDFLV